MGEGMKGSGGRRGWRCVRVVRERAVGGGGGVDGRDRGGGELKGHVEMKFKEGVRNDLTQSIPQKSVNI